MLPAATPRDVVRTTVRALLPAPVRVTLTRDARAALAPIAPRRPSVSADDRSIAPRGNAAGNLSSARDVRGRDAARATRAGSPVAAARAPRTARAVGRASSGMLARLANWQPSPALQLFLAWLFGASILLSQLVLGVIRRSRLASTATDLLPAPWERSRARLRSRGAMPERVRLYATVRSSMPMTWGVLRPVILVPEHSDWTDDERDAALLHELAHVRRGDALWLTVLSLVRALHWYNPLAWWLCAAERLAREEACDDLVLDAGVRPSAYAEQLLGIVREPSEWRTPAAALAMARPASLARRLHAILRAEQPRDLPGGAMRALSIGGAVLLAGCIGTASPVRRASTAPARDLVAGTRGATRRDVDDAGECRPKRRRVALRRRPRRGHAGRAAYPATSSRCGRRGARARPGLVEVPASASAAAAGSAAGAGSASAAGVRQAAALGSNAGASLRDGGRRRRRVPATPTTTAPAPATAAAASAPAAGLHAGPSRGTSPARTARTEMAGPRTSSGRATAARLK